MKKKYLPDTHQPDKKILKALQSLLGKKTRAVHEPYFGGKEKVYIEDCIESTYVSSLGDYVNRFERELAEYTGAKRSIVVVNGTAALQVALKVAGVAAGDEVIIPSLTFVATANAVHYVGGIPHLADVEESTLGLDPSALRSWLNKSAEKTTGGFRNKKTGRRISTLVPMHAYGHPCNIDGLLAVAKDFQLSLVEDAAESLGSFYQNRHTGTFGKLGTLSFNGNKIITTGGGGAILTNDEKLADYTKHLVTTAKVPNQLKSTHDEIGYNFRMPNLNAALGCAQLEQLPDFLASKRRLYESYRNAISHIKSIRLMSEPAGCVSNYWLQTIILNKEISDQLDKILETTCRAGIITRPTWELMHNLEMYKYSPRAPLPVSESLSKRIINLPSGVNLV